MLQLCGVHNVLSDFVRTIPRNTFQSVENLTLFPKLSVSDLKYISLGTYQIAQARSYCQIHLNANQGRFVVFYCSEDQCRRICEKIGVQTSKPALVYVKLKSRFQSTQHHSTYVLFDLEATGKDVVVAYCCSCKNGLRTVGCCSHIMTIIWYVYHIDHNKLKLPSPQLNSIFSNDEDTIENSISSGSESVGEQLPDESDSQSE